jgi:hypothetical protein
MAIHAINESTSSAEIIDGQLVLHQFNEDDPVVLRVVTEGSDLVEATRSCLQVGARALLSGHAALDEVLVGRSFDQLVDRLDASVDTGVTRIASTATALLGEEDGALTKVLGDVRGELTARLDQLFDPDSKSSALALIEEILGTATARGVAQLRASVDPDNADSPLGRLRAELSQLVKERDGEVLEELRKLVTSLAVEDGKAELWERTTLKGVAYEDVVHLAFGEVVAHHNDIIDAVGRETGATGALVGDITITLNSEETGGCPQNAVVEVKRKRLSLRKTLEELDRAMANRDAGVGIAVFSSQEFAPIPTLFVPYGNKAVLVLDAEEPDVHAAELAYCWARWVLRRSRETEPGKIFDAAAFAEALAAATRALERASTIRRCHSTVTKQVSQASEELGSLVTDVRQALDDLREIGTV